MAEGLPSINHCSMSREVHLSLGSGANYSEMCTYLLAYTQAHIQSHAFILLPGNDTSLQHHRWLSCKLSLVLLVLAQLIQMKLHAHLAYSITVAHDMLVKNKTFQP